MTTIARSSVTSGPPDIAVVVPTRDEAHNIPRFLRSLPPWIALVVVDASRDATPEIVLAERPAGTRVHRHPGHIATARHIGAQAALSEWLVFTDADVEFTPDYFPRLARRIATADRRTAGWFGVKSSRDGYRWYNRAFRLGQAAADLAGVPAASGSNMVVRRSAYFAVGGFDSGLRCNEDSELGWRIARAGLSYRFAPELVVRAFDHRRLAAGPFRKTAHSLTRCLLLYADALPHRWRVSDWGYWRSTDRGSVAHATDE